MTAAQHAKIAFLHIPRTGGTAFGSLLDRMYEGQTKFIFQGDDDGSTASKSIGKFVEMDARHKNSFRLLRGHFIFGFDPDLHDFKYVTILRDPIQRLTSYYYYILNEERHYLREYILQRRMGLAEFLTSNVTIELDNYQVRAIAGMSGGSAGSAVTREQCDLAKENLANHFHAFGLLERMPDSIGYISHRFGWTPSAISHVNVGNYPRAPSLPESTLADVASKNRFDIELYRFAQELFESRIPRSGKSCALPQS